MSDDRQVEPAETGLEPSEPEDYDGIADIIPLAALAIPLVAVGIPFLAVAGSMGLGGVVLGTVAVLVVLLVATSLVKGTISLRHRQRVKELHLQLELTRQETAKLAEVNRIVVEPPGRP